MGVPEAGLSWSEEVQEQKEKGRIWEMGGESTVNWAGEQWPAGQVAGHI